MMLRLLDLFCGAGGAAMGYHQAGFDDIVGVDIKPMKRYPFTFVQGDALEYVAEHGHEFDAIHASPPCQAYAHITKATKSAKSHTGMIGDTRQLLTELGKPYVIENVPGAKKELVNPLMLCGTMFALGVIRHRFFECSPALWFAPMQCHHNGKLQSAFHKKSNGDRAYELLPGYKYISVVGHSFKASEGRTAMRIDWMTRDELAQAIPPAYTKFIGGHLLKTLETS